MDSNVILALNITNENRESIILNWHAIWISWSAVKKKSPIFIILHAYGLKKKMLRAELCPLSVILPCAKALKTFLIQKQAVSKCQWVKVGCHKTVFMTLINTTIQVPTLPEMLLLASVFSIWAIDIKGSKFCLPVSPLTFAFGFIAHYIRCMNCHVVCIPFPGLTLWNPWESCVSISLGYIC